MHDGRKVCILADGRLVNLAAGEGHPAAVMDMSFANQALSAAYLAKHHKSWRRKFTTFPSRSTRRSRRFKLSSMGIDIDVLTPEQIKYMASWSEGT